MSIFNEVIAEEDGKKLKAYVAKPASGQGPGLILLHEVYGVNESIKAIADEMAHKGFVVVCPNMYWRHNEDASFRPQAPGEVMTPDLERQRDEARDLMFSKLDHASVPADIKTVADKMRAAPHSNGKVGAMGFCLGAKVAYLAAVKGYVDAAVPFYPTPELHKMFDPAEAKATSSPIVFLLGGTDPYVTMDEKKSIIDVSASTTYYLPGLAKPVVAHNAAGSSKIQTHYFSANGHAFARKGGKDYDPAVADHAYSLASSFLAAILNLDTGTKAPPAVPFKTPASPLYKPEPKR